MARALIIDDEKNILNILRTLLVKLDFEVKMAHDGREGIELFEDGHDFDLVITDIRMPGWTVIKLPNTLEALASRIPQ
jgi:CheY-like chemotaxis protein